MDEFKRLAVSKSKQAGNAIEHHRPLVQNYFCTLLISSNLHSISSEADYNMKLCVQRVKNETCKSYNHDIMAAACNHVITIWPYRMWSFQQKTCSLIFTGRRKSLLCFTSLLHFILDVLSCTEHCESLWAWYSLSSLPDKEKFKHDSGVRAWGTEFAIKDMYQSEQSQRVKQ